MSVGAICCDFTSFESHHLSLDYSYPCSSRRRKLVPSDIIMCRGLSPRSYPLKGSALFDKRTHYVIAEARMLSAIDPMVYRLKVAEPHILGLNLFILASSGHLLYRWRVHIDIGRSSYGLRLYTKSYTISYHSFICMRCTSAHKPLSYLVLLNQTKFAYNF